MGFDVDTPLYHGTDADIRAFDPDASPISYDSDVGRVFMTNSPSTASAYAQNGPFGAKREGANVLPLFVRRDRFLDYGEGVGARSPAAFFDQNDYILTDAQRQGFEGVVLRNEAGEEVWVTLDPRNIRSRFARFDPAKRDSSDLMAALPLAVGGGGLLSALMRRREEA